MLYKIASTRDDLGDEVWVLAGTSGEPTLLRECANGSLAFELDTGRMLVRRNNGWEEISSGANMRSGRVNLPAGGTANITFSRPFRNPPVITATAQFQNTDASCTYSCFNITTTGFTLNGQGNPAGFVGWVAVEI